MTPETPTPPPDFEPELLDRPVWVWEDASGNGNDLRTESD